MPNHAINELRIKLATYEADESAYRAEGNVEQAKRCAERAESIRAAIATLEESK